VRIYDADIILLPAPRTRFVLVACACAYVAEEVVVEEAEGARGRPGEARRVGLRW